MRIIILLALLLVSGFVGATSKNVTIKDDNTKFCQNDCKYELNKFKKYAREGSDLARLALAIMHFRGQGTDIDADRAYRYLLKAAKNDEPGAVYQLGYLHMYGMYVQQDLEKALKWMKRASFHHVLDAKVRVMYLEQKLNLKQSVLSANTIYEKRLKKFKSQQAEIEARQKEVDNTEVILVTHEGFTYADVLDAAEEQTCTAIKVCTETWRNGVMAPLIRIGGEG